MKISASPAHSQWPRIFFRLALLLALVLSLLPPTPAAARDIIVGPGINDWPCSEQGLRDAITYAQPEDTINIRCEQIDIANTIQLTKNVHFRGLLGGPDVINAQGSARVFDIHAGVTVYLSFLIIEGGNAGNSDGGDIYNGGTLYIFNCYITGGHAANGGGIFNGPGATLNVRSSIISENTATFDGGGISNAATGQLTIGNFNVIENNAAGNVGGAIYNVGIGFFTPGSVYGSNVAGYAGGAIAVVGGALTIAPHRPASSGNLMPAADDNLAALAAVVSPTLFISNSAGLGGGGAIYNTANLTIGNVAILSNTSTNAGGGIESYTGMLNIADAFVAYNSASNIGGGIDFYSGTMTATSISVISNTSGFSGGGLAFSTGTAVITGSTFMSNTAQGPGGAISTGVGSLRLDRSTVAHNQANTGGGLEEGIGGSTTIVNSTFSANNASTGGGIENGNILTITSSTIVSNTGGANVDNSGGGLWLHNTIVAFGAPLNCTGTITSTGYNLENANTCNAHAAGDHINTVPHLGPLQNNGGLLAGSGGTGLPFDGQAAWTHALITPTVAIDHGDQLNCPATDERGAARPVNGCDIGAYEFGAKIPQTINFSLPALIGKGQSPYPLGGSATSGLVVTYTVSGAPCSVAGSNQLMSSLGACNVTAHQAGDANYLAALDVSQAITVGVTLFLPVVLR